VIPSSTFSPAQLQAITAPAGPMAIVAGPGCGKTTVLAGRIAYLINRRGLDPAGILVVSFTTEAARRLRREVARQLGDRAGDVAILTLHALGRRVIDTWAIRLGYQDRPSVVPPDEARALLTSAAEVLGWDLAAVSLGDLSAAVDRWRLLPAAETRQSDPLAPLGAAYEERLRRHGAIDFVAMLSLPLRLFDAHESALRVLQDAYQCVMADEVQDFDLTQWRLVELLAARHGDLVVAGDDAQCVFSWRGANPRALRDFAEHHPDASTVTLDKNHRSTDRLVRVGNALGELLACRGPLWTDNPPGPMPRLLVAEDEHAEAGFVAQQIGALLDRGLLPHPGEASVVFRTRAQADVLVGALRAAGLPYSLYGHADLFGTRPVRDVFAYLRLALNPADRGALARVADVPRRGLARLAASLLEEPVTIAELPGRASEFGPAAVSAAAGLAAAVYELHAEAVRGASLPRLLDRALDRTGYRAWLEHHPDGTRRLRLLARLRVLAQRVDVPLAEWLDGVALGEDLVLADEEVVRLSSVHMAKGREWRATFAIGVEEGLFPHSRAIAAANASPDADALDEELRGLYVALTRARERLYVSACRQRSRGDRFEPRQPSRWLRALPPDLLASA
jgi:DNA helicase-2/ATP-dependent DNA helicase PcrA